MKNREGRSTAAQLERRAAPLGAVGVPLYRFEITRRNRAYDRGRGVAWADFDGDGNLDLFTVGIQASHGLFMQSGAGFKHTNHADGLRDHPGGWSAIAAEPHRLALQVSDNDPQKMNTALNVANNVTRYYKERGESVDIKIVAFNKGLHMLRRDTSPVVRSRVMMPRAWPSTSTTSSISVRVCICTPPF